MPTGLSAWQEGDVSGYGRQTTGAQARMGQEKANAGFPVLPNQPPASAAEQPFLDFTSTQFLLALFIPGEHLPASPRVSQSPLSGAGIAQCSVFHAFHPGPLHGQARILRLTPPG